MPEQALKIQNVRLIERAGAAPLAITCIDGSTRTLAIGESCTVERGPRGEFLRFLDASGSEHVAGAQVVAELTGTTITIGAGANTANVGTTDITGDVTLSNAGAPVPANPMAFPYERAARAYAAAAVARKTATDNMQYAADELEHHEIATGEPPPINGPKRDALDRAIRHYNACTDREIEAEEALRRAALELCGEDPAIADDPL